MKWSVLLLLFLVLDPDLSRVASASKLGLHDESLVSVTAAQGNTPIDKLDFGNSKIWPVFMVLFILCIVGVSLFFDLRSKLHERELKHQAEIQENNLGAMADLLTLSNAGTRLETTVGLWIMTFMLGQLIAIFIIASIPSSQDPSGQETTEHSGEDAYIIGTVLSNVVGALCAFFGAGRLASVDALHQKPDELEAEAAARRFRIGTTIVSYLFFFVMDTGMTLCLLAAWRVLLFGSDSTLSFWESFLFAICAALSRAIYASPFTKAIVLGEYSHHVSGFMIALVIFVAIFSIYWYTEVLRPFSRYTSKALFQMPVWLGSIAISAIIILAVVIALVIGNSEAPHRSREIANNLPQRARSGRVHGHDHISTHVEHGQSDGLPTSHLPRITALQPVVTKPVPATSDSEDSM